MSLVEATNLSKSYRTGKAGASVLRGVDLAVEPGEIVCIVGPSGCGKTTLLNLVGALDVADGGNLIVAGTRLTPYVEREAEVLRRLRLGFVFQFYNLLPTLTLLENVKLAGEAAGDTGVGMHRAARELLDRVGLGPRADAFPAELSGGEQQRAAVVRAALRRPALLLADEPTGNLDRAGRDLVAGLIRELARERGTACIVVSHDEAMASGADRVLRMEDGRIMPVAQ